MGSVSAVRAALVVRVPVEFHMEPIRARVVREPWPRDRRASAKSPRAPPSEASSSSSSMRAIHCASTRFSEPLIVYLTAYVKPVVLFPSRPSWDRRPC